jgi:hypothetical protein
VHASNGPPCSAKHQIRLNGQEVETVFRELSGTPRSQKPPALIMVRIWIYHFGTYNTGLPENHSATILLS